MTRASDAKVGKCCAFGDFPLPEPVKGAILAPKSGECRFMAIIDRSFFCRKTLTPARRGGPRHRDF
jgi:hypothetical protein